MLCGLSQSNEEKLKLTASCCICVCVLWCDLTPSLLPITIPCYLSHLPYLGWDITGYRSRCHGNMRLNDVSKRPRHPRCCFAPWSISTRGVRAYALNDDLEYGHGTRSVRAYALNDDLEYGHGTRSVRAYALNSHLEHGRGLGPWSIAEKLQLR